jgi:hypothetical protein
VEGIGTDTAASLLIGQDQEGDHPLPEAIHRPRGLPDPSFTVPKQAPDFGTLTNIEASPVHNTLLGRPLGVAGRHLGYG